MVLRSLALVLLLAPAAARAQTPAWCLPGTTICAGGNGNGGGGLGAGGNASGRVSPAGAQGNAQSNAQGNGQGNAQGQAHVPPPPAPAAPAPPPAPAPVVEPAPRPAQPAAPAYVPYRPSGPPSTTSGTVCAAARAGFWSGYKAGGCFGVASYGRKYGVGAEVLVLGGGTITTLDILVQPFVTINLVGPASSNFGNLYVKIGATFPAGFSIPTRGGRGSGYVRMGGLVGLGYDVELGDGVAWKVLEASFFTDGQLRGSLSDRTVFMDRLDHGFDMGLQLSSGFHFH